MICGKMLFWNRALLNLILNFSCMQIKIGVHFDLYQQNRSNRQEVCRYCWPEGEMVWHWIQVGGYTRWENSGEQSNQLSWILWNHLLNVSHCFEFLKKKFYLVYRNGRIVDWVRIFIFHQEMSLSQQISKLFREKKM